MATLSVIRQKGVHQHFHRGLRQRSKTDKVALVAVMVTMYRILRTEARPPQGQP